MSHLHGVGIHDPRHDLRRGIDVGGRYVLIGTDDEGYLAGKAARQILQLLHRHRLGIADHAAFGAAERNIDERALPRHPHRKGLDFVERHVRMKTDAALRRPARHIVLHAVTAKDLVTAGIHARRDGHFQNAARFAQELVDRVGKTDEPGDFVELSLRHLPDVRLRLGSRAINALCHDVYCVR
jgi:hypothetical protein